MSNTSWYLVVLEPLDRWIMMNLHRACKGKRETWRFYQNPNHCEPKEGHLGTGGRCKKDLAWLILSKNEMPDPRRSFKDPFPFSIK